MLYRQLLSKNIIPSAKALTGKRGCGLWRTILYTISIPPMKHLNILRYLELTEQF